MDVTVDIFPSPLRGHKRLSQTYILPEKIRTVYDEATNAFRANCYLLAGVGFRAVIEAICIDKQISGRDLESKINNLAKNRLITDKEAARLHSIRFIGNDSVHEMAVPKEKALYVVLEIVEHLLKNLYLIDIQAKGEIETVTTTFDEFVELLGVHLKRHQTGDEYPLAKFFGKDMRRLNQRLSEFEATLISEIDSGNYKHLTVGKLTSFGNSREDVQHFVIKSFPEEFNDIAF